MAPRRKPQLERVSQLQVRVEELLAMNKAMVDPITLLHGRIELWKARPPAQISPEELNLLYEKTLSLSTLVAEIQVRLLELKDS
ncbi:MAG: hypothetical protein HY652_05280 [Acidobacteria bacterium]|nr:hypothetical protein [Acidobacteriota bacterium]